MAVLLKLSEMMARMSEPASKSGDARPSHRTGGAGLSEGPERLARKASKKKKKSDAAGVAHIAVVQPQVRHMRQPGQRPTQGHRDGAEPPFRATAGTAPTTTAPPARASGTSVRGRRDGGGSPDHVNKPSKVANTTNPCSKAAQPAGHAQRRQPARSRSAAARSAPRTATSRRPEAVEQAARAEWRHRHDFGGARSGSQ